VTIEDVTQRLDREHDIAEKLDNQSSEIPHLLGALDDRNWRVRLEAVHEMSQLAAPDAIAALLQSVRDNHRNFALLNSALNVLRLTDVDTHSTLIEFLKGDDQDLRIQAALSLGEQRHVRAIPALMEATWDENVNVVYHSIEALGKLRAVEAVDRLMEFAESKDFFLAFPAIEALGEIGNSGVSFRILPLLQNECAVRLDRSKMQTKFLVRFDRILGLGQEGLVVRPFIGLIDVGRALVLSAKMNRVRRILESRRRGRHESVNGCVLQTRRPVVLHPVRVFSAAKDFESFPSQGLVFRNGVVVIPNPVRVPELLAAGDQFRKAGFRDHVATDQIIPPQSLRIVRCTLRRVGREDHVMALLLNSNGEAESGVVGRRNDEAHL
jgi:hypothetical protein